MKKSDIRVLQAQLMKYLEGYYQLKGFKFNKEESSFKLKNVKIFMGVETEDGPYYTIRPAFTVIYKDIYEKLNSIISEQSPSNFMKIHYNSHFYLDNHLATLFNIDEFDECTENSFNKYSSVFEYRISNPEGVLQTLSRHKKFMESVGFTAIQICNNSQNYYKFLEKIVSVSLNDYENYFANKTTAVLNRIQASNVYTLCALGKSNDLIAVNNIISRYNNVLGDTHYNQIAMAKLILNYYNN